jgi:hypothetical protein
MANYKKWSEVEVNFLRSNFEHMNDAELANKLSVMTGENITYGMVRRQRRKLNISKPRGRPRKIRAVESTES